MLIVRHYQQDAVAGYLHVVAIAMAATLVIDFAFEQCSVHYSKVTNSRVIDLWRMAARLKVIMLSIIAVLAFLMLSSTEETLLNVFFLMIPAFYLGPVFESQGMNIEYACIQLAEKILLVALVGTAVWLGGGMSFVFLAHLVSSGASFLAQRYYLGEFSSTRGASQLPQSLSPHRVYFEAYFPVYLVLLAQLAYGNISRLFIEEKAGALVFAQVTLVLQVINVMAVFQGQMDRHIRPQAMAAVTDRARHTLETALGFYRRYLALLIVVGFITAWVAPEVIWVLFGDKWRDAAPALRVGALLMLSVACMRLIDILSVATGLTRVNLAANITAALVLIFAITVLPPQTSTFYIGLIFACQAMQVLVSGLIVSGRLRSMHLTG